MVQFNICSYCYEFHSSVSFNFICRVLYYVDDHWGLTRLFSFMRNSICAQVGLVLVPQMCFCFVGLPFFPSASWPLSFLSLFLSFSSSSDLAWFMRECLTGAGLLCMDTLSCIHGHTFLHSWTHFLACMDTLSCMHGHTFLHSWTHFLAFMDTLSCIHGHTFLHSWSGPMTLVVGLLHGATFLYNLPLVLFVSFIGP